jgi:hypothetical protein
MPFDGARFAFSDHELLDAALSESGLRAIDPGCLARHAAEQLRRHPANWAYRHQHAIALAQIAVLLTGVGLFVGLLSAQHFPSALIAGLAMFGLGSSVLLLPVKGPAEWRERPLADLALVPSPIREAAERLRNRLPGTELVIGELYQERVRLDPYLVAEFGQARAILGIWDGDIILACA